MSKPDDIAAKLGAVTLHGASAVVALIKHCLTDYSPTYFVLNEITFCKEGDSKPTCQSSIEAPGLPPSSWILTQHIVDLYVCPPVAKQAIRAI